MENFISKLFAAIIDESLEIYDDVASSLPGLFKLGNNSMGAAESKLNKQQENNLQKLKAVASLVETEKVARAALENFYIKYKINKKLWKILEKEAIEKQIVDRIKAIQQRMQLLLDKTMESLEFLKAEHDKLKQAKYLNDCIEQLAAAFNNALLLEVINNLVKLKAEIISAKIALINLIDNLINNLAQQISTINQHINTMQILLQQFQSRTDITAEQATTVQGAIQENININENIEAYLTELKKELANILDKLEMSDSDSSVFNINIKEIDFDMLSKVMAKFADALKAKSLNLEDLLAQQDLDMAQKAEIEKTKNSIVAINDRLNKVKANLAKNNAEIEKVAIRLASCDKLEINSYTKTLQELNDETKKNRNEYKDILKELKQLTAETKHGLAGSYSHQSSSSLESKNVASLLAQVKTETLAFGEVTVSFNTKFNEEMFDGTLPDEIMALNDRVENAMTAMTRLYQKLENEGNKLSSAEYNEIVANFAACRDQIKGLCEEITVYLNSAPAAADELASGQEQEQEQTQNVEPSTLGNDPGRAEGIDVTRIERVTAELHNNRQTMESLSPPLNQASHAESHPDSALGSNSSYNFEATHLFTRRRQGNNSAEQSGTTSNQETEQSRHEQAEPLDNDRTPHRHR